MKRREVVAAALFFALFSGGCSGKRPPSPMRDEAIVSTQKLRIGLFDFSKGFDRSGLRKCPNDVPSVELVEEAAVHRQARDLGITPEKMLEWEERFDAFSPLRGYHLLLLVFRGPGKTYLRTVNFLGRYVSTVEMDVGSPSCRDILRTQRLVVIDSSPPIADVKIDGRMVGEAPVWTWLKDGNYSVECVLPGEVFSKVSLDVPKTVDVFCQRENVQPSGAGIERDDSTAEEKAGSLLVYIVGAAAAIAAIVVPILVLF